MSKKIDDSKVLCFVWRPREVGNSGDELIDKIKMPAGAYKYNLFGVTLPWIVEQPDGTYTAFKAKEKVPMTPKLIAVIPGFKSWQDLNSYTTGLWEQIKPMVPIIAIIVVTIGYVMIKG